MKKAETPLLMATREVVKNAWKCETLARFRHGTLSKKEIIGFGKRNRKEQEMG